MDVDDVLAQITDPETGEFTPPKATAAAAYDAGRQAPIRLARAAIPRRPDVAVTTQTLAILDQILASTSTTASTPDPPTHRGLGPRLG